MQWLVTRDLGDMAGVLVPAGIVSAVEFDGIRDGSPSSIYSESSISGRGEDYTSEEVSVAFDEFTLFFGRLHGGGASSGPVVLTPTADVSGRVDVTIIAPGRPTMCVVVLCNRPNQVYSNEAKIVSSPP